MPRTFRPYQPNQLLLLSPDLREWLPSGHLAHHVGDLVDALDLSAFYVPYKGDGPRNAPYEPSMMVKVLIYAYATGVFSSRAIARKVEADVAFRVLGAHQHAGARNVVLQSSPAGATSRMCASVSIPRSPTSTTRSRAKRRRSLSSYAPTVRGSAVLPSKTSTATGHPSRLHSSPNTICSFSRLPSRE